jgi:hypothetical protein
LSGTRLVNALSWKHVEERYFYGKNLDSLSPLPERRSKAFSCFYCSYSASVQLVYWLSFVFNWVLYEALMTFPTKKKKKGEDILSITWVQLAVK